MMVTRPDLHSNPEITAFSEKPAFDLVELLEAGDRARVAFGNSKQ